MAADVIKTNTNADNTVRMGATVSVTKTGKVDRLVDDKMPQVEETKTFNDLNTRFDDPTYYG